ncbi:hypothetical protein [Candidatus Electronema sp. TJ]|uniref:hypothetical protein n=1 Tax=Candidatus Electronema sp. TJ TaxID=3401573 RepID=UPI003AA7B8ED
MNQHIEPAIYACCQKIIQECFWEYKMTAEDILGLAKKGSDQEKYFLFTKILENATDVLKSLSVFAPSDQQDMLRRYIPPKFNCFFLERRYKILKYFLLNEQTDIPELRWNI